jgi:stage III sporulation protein SpoIIIAA
MLIRVLCDNYKKAVSEIGIANTLLKKLFPRANTNTIYISESEISKSTVPNEIGLRYGPKEAQQYDLYGGDSLPPSK